MTTGNVAGDAGVVALAMLAGVQLLTRADPVGKTVRLLKQFSGHVSIVLCCIVLYCVVLCCVVLCCVVLYCPWLAIWIVTSSANAAATAAQSCLV